MKSIVATSATLISFFKKKKKKWTHKGKKTQETQKLSFRSHRSAPGNRDQRYVAPWLKFAMKGEGDKTKQEEKENTKPGGKESLTISRPMRLSEDLPAQWVSSVIAEKRGNKRKRERIGMVKVEGEADT